MKSIRRLGFIIGVRYFELFEGLGELIEKMFGPLDSAKGKQDQLYLGMKTLIKVQ